jgi:hypothetical protein
MANVEHVKCAEGDYSSVQLTSRSAFATGKPSGVIAFINCSTANLL